MMKKSLVDVAILLPVSACFFYFVPFLREIKVFCLQMVMETSGVMLIDMAKFIDIMLWYQYLEFG